MFFQTKLLPKSFPLYFLLRFSTPRNAQRYHCSLSSNKTMDSNMELKKIGSEYDFASSIKISLIFPAFSIRFLSNLFSLEKNFPGAIAVTSKTMPYSFANCFRFVHDFLKIIYFFFHSSLISPLLQ